ncbi:hypothetical protein Salat_0735900 [Sesamum alatum]|uniref:DUF8040 domain-containing protein n=1 Tax=Sesamum alatum TaxID=300844 RepID=A0AAE2CVJ5_9LAMI|nr:hypothetical protein Salat_0735900 [Sesamum alatum]
MSMDVFGRLCYLLENLGGLCRSHNDGAAEQVAVFVMVLSHHTKNMIVKFYFSRSGRTIIKYFNYLRGCLEASFHVAHEAYPCRGRQHMPEVEMFQGVLRGVR